MTRRFLLSVALLAALVLLAAPVAPAAAQSASSAHGPVSGHAAVSTQARAGSATAGRAAASARPSKLPGPTLTSKVAAAVAQRWSVEPEHVRVEWRPGRAQTVPGPDASVRLLGSGAGGYWVVQFEKGGRTVARLQARTSVETQVPVAARDLQRDSVIGPADIRLATRVVPGPPHWQPGRSGWVARRRIPAGEPLVRPAVGPPNVVSTGDHVRVVWKGNGVQLTVQGIAMGNAAAGERVRVRTGRRRLLGTAAGPGLVSVDAEGGRP